jgi:hypothetical protein
MAQTLAIVVGAEIHDSHRQYRGLLSQGIVAESCVRPRRSATAAQRILLNDVRESGLRRLSPRRAADARSCPKLVLSKRDKVRTQYFSTLSLNHIQAL